MRLPRMTTRRWMALVAVAAFVMAVAVLVRRSNEFRALARQQAYFESMMRLDAWESREQSGDSLRAARSERAADLAMKRKIKYERAARIRADRYVVALRKLPTRLPRMTTRRQ
jgi:hypothetical protein